MLGFYEGVGVGVGIGVGVGDLKTGESELEVLCTDSTACVLLPKLQPERQSEISAYTTSTETCPCQMQTPKAAAHYGVENRYGISSEFNIDMKTAGKKQH
jgi:hypothetical protein